MGRQNPQEEASISADNNTRLFHLRHLLRTFFKPRRNPSADDGNSNKTVGQWCPATKYRMYANVKFKSQKIGDSGVKARSLLDVEFKGRKVMIPRLHLDGTTWTLLFNLMELERQDPSRGTYVTAYCFFISQMACTKEDVELLYIEPRCHREPSRLSGECRGRFLSPLRWCHLGH